MRKNLLVLVLLTVTVLWSAPLLTPAAFAAGDGFGVNDGEPHGDIIQDSTGDPADDSRDGDPGDAGDGYGATGNPKYMWDEGLVEGPDSIEAEGYWLILMSLIQLAP
jgi:hypothetical protein